MTKAGSAKLKARKNMAEMLLFQTAKWPNRLCPAHDDYDDDDDDDASASASAWCSRLRCHWQ